MTDTRSPVKEKTRSINEIITKQLEARRKVENRLKVSTWIAGVTAAAFAITILVALIFVPDDPLMEFFWPMALFVIMTAVFDMIRRNNRYSLVELEVLNELVDRLPR